MSAATQQNQPQQIDAPENKGQVGRLKHGRLHQTTGCHTTTVLQAFYGVKQRIATNHVYGAAHLSASKAEEDSLSSFRSMISLAPMVFNSCSRFWLTCAGNDLKAQFGENTDCDDTNATGRSSNQYLSMINFKTVLEQGITINQR